MPHNQMCDAATWSAVERAAQDLLTELVCPPWCESDHGAELKQDLELWAKSMTPDRLLEWLPRDFAPNHRGPVFGVVRVELDPTTDALTGAVLLDDVDLGVAQLQRLADDARAAAAWIQAQR